MISIEIMLLSNHSQRILRLPLTLNINIVLFELEPVIV